MTLPVLPSWIPQPTDNTAARKAPKAELPRWLQALADIPRGVEATVAQANHFLQGSPVGMIAQAGHDQLAQLKTPQGRLDFAVNLAQPGAIAAVGEASAKPVIARLVRALSEEGGATLHPNGKPFAGSAYMVADPAFTTEVRSPKEIKAFFQRRDVRNALDAGKLIGKWTDPETGVTELSLPDPVPDAKAAQKLAAQRGEQAVGHIEDGTYQGDIRNPHAPVHAVRVLLEQLRTGPQMPRVTEIPTTRGRQLAQAYEALPKNDPNARAAYDALNAEVEKQFQAMRDAGYKVEFTDADPYKNSAEMMKDVRENKTLKVFKTPSDNFHPYMTPEQNDRFRAVHDFLAHAGGGNQFGAVGEENAYRVHASTLSDLAKRALASETRGQNSWVNFGPNSHLPVKERPFAEQKAALFPEHLLGDYDQMGITGPPAIRVNNEWQPTERGVFDRSPEQGVPAGEYREPAPLPFETETRPRAGATELAQQIATDPRVERRIASDVEKGLPLGGRPWYGLLPLRRYLESLTGAASFRDFNMAGAAGSAQTPTHNELNNLSIILFAKKHGISYEAAREEFLRRFPGITEMRPFFSRGHGLLFDRGQQTGFMGPTSPTAGKLKIPNYYHNRMLGANGIPLDTHEKKMIGQALGIPTELVHAGLRDAESYNLATQAYHRIARRYGLHPDQVQAARWLGGGLETGLKSQPRGDFLQTLEDGLLFTARRRGLGESPKELRSLFDQIARGEEFFLPTKNPGGFSVY